MIKLAVIGCGRWGPNHIRNFQSLPGVAVVAAVDSDRTRLARIAEALPGVRLETDVERVWSDPEISAVVVATPTITHHAVVRAAIAAGKHVLCEKPLCESTPKARELAELAAAKGVILMVGHVFLFNDAVAKLREIVTGSEFGAVRHISAIRTNLGPIRQDVNAAADLASHDISIINWMLGAIPISVSASGASYLQPGIEDVVSLAIRYPASVFASIQVSWLSPKKVRQFTVVGTRHMVTWDELDSATPIAIYDAGAESKAAPSGSGESPTVSTWDGEVRLPKILVQEPLKAQAKAFLHAIQTGAADRSDGAFALGVVRTLDAAAESLRQNGAAVEVGSR